MEGITYEVVLQLQHWVKFPRDVEMVFARTGLPGRRGGQSVPRFKQA